MSTEAVAAATKRLTLSRMRLHKALHAHTHHAPTTWLGQHAVPEWVERLKDSPEAQLLWEQAKALYEKKSLGLILGVVVAGGVFIWSRPWRWLLQPAIVAALLPYVLSHLNGKAHPPPPP